MNLQSLAFCAKIVHFLSQLLLQKSHTVNYLKTKMLSFSSGT